MKLRIKEIAKTRGIKMEELADLLGIHQNTLSRTINGNPTLETLQKIAKGLEVDISELFTSNKPIYTKDKNGNLVEIGYLKNHN